MKTITTIKVHNKIHTEVQQNTVVHCLQTTVPVDDSAVPKTTDRYVTAVMFASDRDSSTTTLKNPIAAEHNDRHVERMKASLLRANASMTSHVA